MPARLVRQPLDVLGGGDKGVFCVKTFLFTFSEAKFFLTFSKVTFDLRKLLESASLGFFDSGRHKSVKHLPGVGRNGP